MTEKSLSNSLLPRVPLLSTRINDLRDLQENKIPAILEEKKR
ncbi:hypothetical protein [Nostoc commune]|nr:hypothetical protein [Nostoc commune]